MASISADFPSHLISLDFIHFRYRMDIIWAPGDGGQISSVFQRGLPCPR